jgi:hypothetical protein
MSITKPLILILLSLSGLAAESIVVQRVDVEKLKQLGAPVPPTTGNHINIFVSLPDGVTKADGDLVYKARVLAGVRFEIHFEGEETPRRILVPPADSGSTLATVPVVDIAVKIKSLKISWLTVQRHIYDWEIAAK